MKIRNLSFSLLVCLLVLAGCSKAPILDSQLLITTYVHKIKTSLDTVSTKTSGYIFFADSSTYRVTSYAEAAAGEIHSISDPSKIKSADETAKILEDGTLTFNNITMSPQFIVIFDTERKVYAWRQLDIIPGVDRVASRIRFRIWKEAPITYKEAGWNVVLE